MKTYARISAGKLAQTYITDAAGLVEIATGHPHDTFIESPYFGGPETLYYDGQEVKKIPDSPNPNYLFNLTTFQWEDQRSLDSVKAAANTRVNTARLKANQSSFTYLGKQIAADPLSRSDIDAINGEIANTGTFPAGWPGGWKCIDNTYVAMTTAADWTAFYSAMVAQGTANFSYAQSLKAQIEAATTKEAVEAITWSQP